jgi:hypothetical protein
MRLRWPRADAHPIPFSYVDVQLHGTSIERTSGIRHVLSFPYGLRYRLAYGLHVEERRACSTCRPALEIPILHSRFVALRDRALSRLFEKQIARMWN